MRYQINKTKYLTPEELLNLMRILATDVTRNGLLLRLALASGARAQELLNISKADLDDSNSSVFIRGLKQSNDRELPLDKPLYEALKVLASQTEGTKLFNIGYDRLVDIWQFYRPVKKKFHSLRHTFAIELYRRTKDVLLVQAALGHRNVQNSLVYTEHLYQTEFLKGALLRGA